MFFKRQITAKPIIIVAITTTIDAVKPPATGLMNLITTGDIISLQKFSIKYSPKTALPSWIISFLKNPLDLTFTVPFNIKYIEIEGIQMSISKKV